MSKIRVNGTEITIITQNEEDYICLTEMVAKIEDGTRLIERWLNSKTTVDFLGVWEQLNNPDLKPRNSGELEKM
jgi:hypothetical protein